MGRYPWSPDVRERERGSEPGEGGRMGMAGKGWEGIPPEVGCLSREDSRLVDQRAIQDFSVPGIILMENAGRSVAELILWLYRKDSLGVSSDNPDHRPGRSADSGTDLADSLYTGRFPETFHPWERRLVSASSPRVVIVCGRGNNGGDGFVIARHLRLRGIRVDLFYCGDPSTYPHDAAVMAEILRGDGSCTMTRLDPLFPDESERISGTDTVRMDSFDPLIPLERALNDPDEPPICVVDALLGTGAKGEPRPPLDRIIDRINTATRRPDG
ncbi:MAG: NAD(P)H-hydrate epimerase, partial [Planctomycetia bacterium]|nr:NAD(P)H-hydrate epimerase [Planctomycetia bacterium]